MQYRKLNFRVTITANKFKLLALIISSWKRNVNYCAFHVRLIVRCLELLHLNMDNSNMTG